MEEGNRLTPAREKGPHPALGWSTVLQSEEKPKTRFLGWENALKGAQEGLLPPPPDTDLL